MPAPLHGAFTTVTTIHRAALRPNINLVSHSTGRKVNIIITLCKSFIYYVMSKHMSKCIRVTQKSLLKTRMHSSRMCTVCSSSHLLGSVPGLGGVPGQEVVVGGVPGPGVYLVPGGVPCLGGCTWSGGVVPGPGDVPSLGGCTWSGDIPGPRGVYLVPWGCTCPSTSPLWTDTHTCKNITFATSMWTVNMLTKLECCLSPCSFNPHHFSSRWLV